MVESIHLVGGPGDGMEWHDWTAGDELTFWNHACPPWHNDWPKGTHIYRRAEAGAFVHVGPAKRMEAITPPQPPKP